MQQGWLQVAGLVMDLAGVMLLAIEWLVGYRAQQREEQAGDHAVRQLKSLAFAQQATRDERMAEHYRMVIDQAKDRARSTASEIRRQGHQIRLPVFLLALALIVVGSLLQILGSWPGGIPAIGVVGQ